MASIQNSPRLTQMAVYPSRHKDELHRATMTLEIDTGSIDVDIKISELEYRKLEFAMRSADNGGR